MRLKTVFLPGVLIILVLSFSYCNKSDTTKPAYDAIAATFGKNIDPNNLANYAQQGKPVYITKDNTGANTITNEQATLGRVLFYDNLLSIDNSISCGSCHIQQFAFGDTAKASNGVSGGITGRHSMRLINTRYAVETKFFWDERAATLEAQTTMPVKDHAEMGFSGQAGRPVINDLLNRLKSKDYYQELFDFVYGDNNITEQRLQECLAQFVRSIQSFDAKYDAGRSLVNNDNQPFPNFSAQENQGKNLWLTPPQFNAAGSRIGGGLGCNACHNAPEFDIAPNSRNNGIIGTISGNPAIDINNTRAPSLRDLINPNGSANTVMMHTGLFTTIQQTIGHYGNINGNVQNLDPRLRPNGNGQQLNLTAAEVNAVSAFLRTLTGTAVYSDAKWADPFL